MCIEGLRLLIIAFGRRESAVTKKRGGQANVLRIGDRQRGGRGVAGKGAD